jgi:hypothetical protein
MGLLVPRRVAEEDLAERVNAEVDAQIARAHEISKLLGSIDPHLSIVLAPENADHEEFEHPGYWYVRKRIPGSFDALLPLIGENGERLEPGPWVVDWLKARDLWDPRVFSSKKELKERLRTARTRAKQLESEQRRDEGAVAVRAARRVRGDYGMTHRTDRKGERPKLVLPAGVDAG